jgi:hypothetical protein
VCVCVCMCCVVSVGDGEKLLIPHVPMRSSLVASWVEVVSWLLGFVIMQNLPMRMHKHARPCSQEFARGVKYLDYVPPIIIDEDSWYDQVVDRNFAVCRNGVYRICIEGMQLSTPQSVLMHVVSLSRLCEISLALLLPLFCPPSRVLLHRISWAGKSNDTQP